MKNIEIFRDEIKIYNLLATVFRIFFDIFQKNRYVKILEFHSKIFLSRKIKKQENMKEVLCLK